MLSMTAHKLILLSALFTSTLGAASPPPSLPIFRVVAFGAGDGEPERLANCACVTAAGRPDMCYDADSWPPLVGEHRGGDDQVVYASGGGFITDDPTLALLFYTCGGAGHKAYILAEDAPSAADVLAAGTCDPNGAKLDALAAVACAYVSGEMPAPYPPRGAFASP